MSDYLLVGASPNLTSWLTPVWLLGLGTAAGLFLLLALWGVCIATSRIGLFGNLAEPPQLRNIVSGLLCIVFTLFVFPMVLVRGWHDWSLVGFGTALFYSLVSFVFVVLIGLGLGLSAVTLVSRKTVSEIPMAIREGVLVWVLAVAVSVTVLGMLATAVVREPIAILKSLGRLAYTGEVTKNYTIEATKHDPNVVDVVEIDEQVIGVSFHGSELRWLEFRSTEPLEVSPKSFGELDLATDQFWRIPGNDEPFNWVKSDDQLTLIPNEPVTRLYVRNLGPEDARLRLSIVTAAVYPETKTIPMTAMAVVAVFLLYVLQRSLAPKLSAIALSTCKSEMVQPLFLILLILGAVLLVAFIFIPYYTFGEDIKMLKDAGLTLILVFAIFQAVWAASKSVSEEIEGRTALTVLSKPIGRRDFVLGKFLGIAWTIAIMFVVLGSVFLIVVAYKPVFDSYEGGASTATWQVCHREMVLIVPGLVLAFMEALVLAALSVAFSTRLPLLVNFPTCAAIYVLGHLTPLMVQSALGEFEPVEVVARLFATIFPVLDHFNIQAAVAGGAEVPLAYLGWSLVYCLLYGTVALLLALVMFEDRDLT